MANTRTVSVYLLRQSVGGAEDALTVDLGDLDEYRVPAIGDQARLYVNRSLRKRLLGLRSSTVRRNRPSNCLALAFRQFCS